MSDTKPVKSPVGIIAKFEGGSIQIQIDWGDADTFVSLSDEFMQGVRAYFSEDLIEACRIALEYWHSDHPNDTVAGEEARAKIEAALAKAEGRK